MKDEQEPVESPVEEQKEQKESEDAIVKRITALKDSYEQVTKDTRTEFGEIFNTYMGKEDQNTSTPYDTKETIPKLRTEIAYVKPFIFSGEPQVEIEGIGDEDKAISKIYEKIINHRFRTIPNFNGKIESWVSQGVGFGTSIIRVLWRFQTQDNGDGTQTIVQDEPDVEVPNILDVYYNPIIEETKNQPCLIFRSVIPLDEVKKNPIYDYTSESGVRSVDVLEAGSTKPDVSNSSGQFGTDIPNAQQRVTEGMVEVFEKIDNDTIETIANGHVLRVKDNVYGFKAAVKFIFEPNIIPNRYAGLGLGQNTMGLGKMFYKMFNQALMNAKLGNNGMFMHKKNAVTDKSQLVAKPAGGIEVSGEGPLRDNIEFLQYPDLSGGFMEILNKIDDEHKRASGASDLIQGSASNDTLGQDEMAQANISNRFEIIIRRFKDNLAEVARMILMMELENLQSPDAEILRIFPEELRPQIYQLLISEKDNVKFNVRIKGETNIARNKNMESKRQVELFNLAQNFLTDREKRSFIRRLAELQGIDNIDELIGENNPIMEQQEQMQLQVGAGMQGQEPMQNLIGGGLTDQQ